jgi:hypothetical protein
MLKWFCKTNTSLELKYYFSKKKLFLSKGGRKMGVLPLGPGACPGQYKQLWWRHQLAWLQVAVTMRAQLFLKNQLLLSV